MSDKLVLSLDLAQCPFDRAGVINFFWPCSPEDLLPVRDSLLAELIPLLREEKKGKNAELANALQILFKWFCMEILKVYDACAVHRRFQQRGFALSVPKRFQLLSSFGQGQTPDVTFFQGLAPGPLPGLHIPRAVKRFFYEMRWNRPGKRVFMPANVKEDIFFLYPNSLMLQHTRETEHVFRYCVLADWFHSFDAKVLTAGCCSGPSGGSLIDAVLECANKAFGAGNEALSPSAGVYLRNWMSQAGNFVSFHMRSLLANREKLPHHLWTPSPASVMWSKLLTHAVRLNGGYVTAHDHGYGDAHHEQLAHHFVDFDACDELYVYNRNQAEVKRRELRSALLFNSPPEITCPRWQKLKKAEGDVPMRVIERPLKRIMYVPTAFHGPNVRYRPILSDIVAFDWQVRLLSFFKEMGIEILYKPHPEGFSRPPAGFAEYFGFQELHGPFEKIKIEVDAYLIDFISSSTTATILKSSLPVIFLNPGYPELFPEAEKMLRKRAYVLSCWTDSDNRLRVDWRLLENIVRKERHEFTHEFAEYFYADN